MAEYIKREDALKMCSGEIQNIRYMTDVFGEKYECCVGARRINADEIAEQIKKIPPADVVERKKGKWQITDAYPHNVYCSECHKKFAQTHWAVWGDGSLPRNFCPNCGADLRELK